MSQLQLTSSDGISLSAYRADPGGTPRGALVVCQEIFGVNSHIRSVCDRLAAQGYVAIAPALFDRAQPGVEYGYGAEDIERGRALMSKVPIEAALLDVRAAMEQVAGIGKVGITGFCWGGTVAWAAAGRIDGLACSVPYYGGGIANLLDEKPKCPVMMHFGDKDASIPMAAIEKIRAAQPGVEVHVYPAGHGFNCEQRGSFDEASSRLAFERTIAFLHRHIG
jgi:carboxymethylenebutenolidase